MAQLKATTVSGSFAVTGSTNIGGVLQNDDFLFSNCSQMTRILSPFSFTNNGGTGVYNAINEGYLTWYLIPGLATGSYSSVMLARSINTIPYWSGNIGTNFAKKIRLYCHMGIGMTDPNVSFRMVLGGWGDVRSADSQSLGAQGCGFELRGAENKVYLFAHDGTTFSTSSTGISYNANSYQYNYAIILETDGTGNVNLYFDESWRDRKLLTTTPALTMTGGPTSITGAGQYIHAYSSTLAGQAPVSTNNSKVIGLNTVLQYFP